jgi:hypothetical protein
MSTGARPELARRIETALERVPVMLNHLFGVMAGLVPGHPRLFS